jgi:hypothetical protein
MNLGPQIAAGVIGPILWAVMLGVILWLVRRFAPSWERILFRKLSLPSLRRRNRRRSEQSGSSLRAKRVEVIEPHIGGHVPDFRRPD